MIQKRALKMLFVGLTNVDVTSIHQYTPWKQKSAGNRNDGSVETKETSLYGERMAAQISLETCKSSLVTH